MWDQSTIEQLRSKYHQTFNDKHRDLKKLAIQYENLPVVESEKRQFIEISLKQRSAWYACLVNPNIDVLLIPEYLDSKLSRNILIKRETEQFFKSIENFVHHNSDQIQSIYNSILYIEETEQKSSFDLFSAQKPEPVRCPQGLVNLFKTWDKKFEGFSGLEKLVFTLLDWHQYNGCNFSGQRQMVLWVNFQLWKQYGQTALKFQVENFLFHHFRDIKDIESAIVKILEFTGDEIERYNSDLKELYRNEIAYNHLNSMQKIVSNHIFETGFKLPDELETANAGYIVKLLKRKGFVHIIDFNDPEEIEKQKDSIELLLAKEYIVAVREGGNAFYCLNTSVTHKESDLFKYKNTTFRNESIAFEEFAVQPKTTPTISIEMITNSEPVQAAVKSRRQKAFFG